MHSQLMHSLLSPHGVYSPADVDTALARVFGAGVRPLHIEEAVFEAMLAAGAPADGALSEAQDDPHNERGVRAFVGARWPLSVGVARQRR